MAASLVPASFFKMLFSKSLTGSFLRNHNYQLYGIDPTRDISVLNNLKIYLVYAGAMTIKSQMFHASSLNIIDCGTNTHSIITSCAYPSCRYI